MIREYAFGFDELAISRKEVGFLMGYGDGTLPAPFDRYLEAALHDCLALSDIKAAFRIVGGVTINTDDWSLLAEAHRFNAGKIICRELKGSERFAFFICTAGKTISRKATHLLHGDDPVQGYVYDILGNLVTEAACDAMQAFLEEEIKRSGDRLTNRYSPGYCQWPVSDQHTLLSLFPENTCGISLTSSALMVPVKSVSGVIGIGKNVRFREQASCMLCSFEDCTYRKLKTRMKIV